ncbi:MAG TPA: hypothetical protein GXZ75_08515 [Clostridia bacterium]|nr:hypothetical protein [Clostridia bacterium]
MPVISIYCKNEYFHRGSALLNSRGATFFGFEWLDESAKTLMCAQWDFIHWFGKWAKQIET